ncbi:unnamed protein product [Hyaloperonospora brassicae]|uniref:Uncharacterized protein n=1 Tax=Hyaloperonospora brassicae TaxID=162125 RepID=A0AAV0UQ09_HYABA|nr:unnamed protein product [Hyaloperonospora brassicae]
MGGGPITSDVVRSSCFVTFPERAHAEPVPVDAWYLFAAGLTFLRRLARDRVGDAMHVALVLQLPSDADDKTERRYASVSSNAVLQRALQVTFASPEKALVLHVIDVGHVRGQQRIHVRPEANANVSPEPVAPLALVFPTLAVDGRETPIAVQVPTARVMSESSDEPLRRSMVKYHKGDCGRWKTAAGAAREGAAVDKTATTSREHVGGWCGIEERDYTKRVHEGGEQVESHGTAIEATEESSGRLVPQVQSESATCVDKQLADASDVPLATVVVDSVANTAQTIPSDYVMLELQTGAGLPEAAGMASSTYFISSRWAEQADEMSASMVLERPPPARAARGTEGLSSGRRSSTATLEDSFVVLERHEL